MITGHPLENVINGPAHHTLHHLYFNVNYGQVGSALSSTCRCSPTSFIFSTSHGLIAMEARIDILKAIWIHCWR
jgi:hypothetical protein